MQHKNVTFVSNDKEEGTKVLKVIQNELNQCDSLSLSVAFITQGGLTMLANQLLSLQNRGVKGRILTSTYQHFNDPKVYHKLLSYPNIEVKVFTEQPHHTKGYIFENGRECKVLIGSSNLTSSALAVNREWNLEVTTDQNSKLVNDVRSEFERMWDQAEIVDSGWIDNYSKGYEESRIISQRIKTVLDTEAPIFPNIMQTEALRNLDRLRDDGATKAILISATGTGKTYLSAFDVRNAKANKILFVIHREQIARDAERTFKKVMPNKSTGFLTGSSKDFDVDIIFTTIQSISQDYNLNNFKSDHFDYIIYDEAHRSGAHSYRKVMDYFSPKFSLGMTATPERSDDFNVFELFDYNIAYEIRLQDALKQEMLTPFHYFGVTDVTIDDVIVDDQATIAQLMSKQRISYIIDKMSYYGFSGERVKGLIFCSRNDEASELSLALNKQGLRTLALSGKHSQEDREVAIQRLTALDGDLDYIITVDIFNEGIDIPEVNQIVMLRPTQSAIIFVQQLGRGLRNCPDKDYVVVIDFIGNYKNNFLIPIALSGDKSMSKNNLRKFVMEGNSVIPGVSTIEFDEITKERIYNAIDKTNLSGISLLRREYASLKYRVGRIPNLQDYVNYGSIDPQVIFGTKYRSHYEFLKYAIKEEIPDLSKISRSFLTFVSYELSSGKRVIEIDILNKLLNQKQVSINELKALYQEEVLASAIRYLQLDFLTDTSRRRYDFSTLISIQDEYLRFSEALNDALNDQIFRQHFEDILLYSSDRYNTLFSSSDDLGFVLGQQYTRKDVSWLLNWDTNQESTIYGYKVDRKTKTIPIFVTYSKSGDIDASIDYDDHFLDREHFNWMSRNKRTLESEEIKAIIDADKLGFETQLFVKRSDGEDKYFYYLGKVTVIDYDQTEIQTKTGSLPIVRFTFKLHNYLKDDLYYYFIER